MKVIFNKNDIKTHLSIANRAVVARPTHPILGNVLLVADKEKSNVSITGYDFNVGIRTQFGAEVLESGSVTVGAKLLNDLVSRLVDGEITLEAEEMESTEEDDENSATLYIKSNSGTLSLRTIRAKNYPELPNVVDSEPLSLPVLSLTEGLKNVTFAAATEDVKQILTGVHLKGTKDGIEFAATDGHRLAVVTTFFEEDLENEQPVSKEFELTIPARALKELDKILATNQPTDKVAIYVADNVVVFEIGNQLLTSRLLDGPYPAYEKMIPEEFSRTMVSDRKQLISSLEVVSVLANQKNNLVKMVLDSISQRVYLSVEAKELGTAEQNFFAQISGDSIDVGFNIKYLMEGLKIFSSNDVQMQLNEPTRPIIFSPLGGTKIIYLVMPVQIRE